jgi:predicted metal-dependent peptidase
MANKTTNGSIAKPDESRIMPFDKARDAIAREALITARISLWFKQPFFGNLGTRLKLINADEWLETAATDGKYFYYNSKFINDLREGEVEFLISHEILHVAYSHMSRRESRNPQLWNIAADYAINADLKKHNIGTFITTVPALYEEKYVGKSAEEIYDDLMKNVKKISIEELLNKLLDEHMEENEEGEEQDGEPKPGEGSKGRIKMSEEEKEQLKNDLRSAIVQAAQASEAGTIPGNIERMVKELTNPIMDWRELIKTSLTSLIKVDFSWTRVHRKSWHLGTILPGQMPGERIDVAVAIDTSGSISEQQCKDFVSEIGGMMDAFNEYKLTVFCFDTSIHASKEYSTENMEDISEYQPGGGGGTSFPVIFDHVAKLEKMPDRLIVFTDGYCDAWGPDDLIPTVWVIHGSKTITAPHGQTAYYDE